MTRAERFVQQAMHVQELQGQLTPGILPNQQDALLVQHMKAATTKLLDMIQAMEQEDWEEIRGQSS